MTNPKSLGRHATTAHGLFAAAILAVLLLLAFFPFVFGNKTLLESSREAPSIMPDGSYAGKPVRLEFARTRDPGGGAWFFDPLLQLDKQEYLEDRTLPVWNPYQAFGTPLAANMQSQVFEPITVAYAMVHGPYAVNFYLLLRLFVAGICAYLYAKFFVSFIPALAAGVASMLSGYFLLFLSMPHLSVEVLLPAAFLSAEHLLRSPRFRTLTCFAFVIFLVLTGGMPESSFLLLTLTYIYMLFRFVTDPLVRSSRQRLIFSLALATISGIGFSAVLLLPFRQFMRYSYDVHQFSNLGYFTGLQHESWGPSIFTYLFPFLLGPSYSNVLNYAGSIAFFLVLVAALSIRRGNGEHRHLRVLTVFFGLLLVGVVLKRYGFPVVNSIGSLPIFNLVIFTKYEEPLLSFAAAQLCAIALERFARQQVSLVAQVIAFVAAFLTLPVALICNHETVAKNILANKINAGLAIWSFALPTALLLLLAILLILVRSRNGQFNLQIALLALLTCELFGAYIVPAYYVWNPLPASTSNPYIGAPYIQKLVSLAGNDRIFAEDSTLFPNWASAFRLQDIRSLDAMYYKKYLPFVQQFFRLVPQLDGNELVNRFTGSGGLKFDDPLQRRLLEMGSVKYVVTMPSNLLSESNIIDEIWAQNAGHFSGGREAQINRQQLAIDGIQRNSLGEHPPYDRLPYHFQVSGEKQKFHFSYGINPAAFPVCGDGVEFIVEVRDNSGTISKFYDNFIDPRHDVSLRHWIDGDIDLSRYAGQDVDLLLSTGPGPKGDACADWAFWSNLEFGQSSLFKVKYNKEVKILEYSHTLPRASIFYSASVQQSEAEILKYLVDPSFDVFKTVLLNRTAMDANQSDWITQLNTLPGKSADSGRIVSYKPREVVVEASLRQRGILVLNDSDYPGWTVEVDKRKDKIVSANYMFRGVFLEPGKHVVRFSYEPLGVRLGETISAASFLAFASFGVLKIVRRRKPAL